MGWPTCTARARSSARVAARAEIAATVLVGAVVVAGELDFDEPQPTASQTTKPIAAAMATRAPMPTRRSVQEEAGRWFTATKDRFRSCRVNPARRAATITNPRAVSSVGRAPARQAGGHWFEPSTAHHRKARSGGLFLLTSVAAPGCCQRRHGHRYPKCLPWRAGADRSSRSWANFRSWG